MVTSDRDEIGGLINIICNKLDILISLSLPLVIHLPVKTISGKILYHVILKERDIGHFSTWTGFY